jgi:tetratricopeptide (TPR) repeat protein
VDTLRRLVAQVPEDVEGWYLLGEALFHSQAYTAADPDTIRAAFDSVLWRDSTLSPALLHPMELAIRSRDSATYIAYVNRFAQLVGPEMSAVDPAIREMVWSQEISDSAIRVLARGGPLGSALGSLYRRPDVTSDFILDTGDRLPAALPTPAQRLFDRKIQAYAAAGFGRLREARRLADSIALVSPHEALDVLAYPILLGIATQEYGGRGVANWLRSPPARPDTPYFLALADLSQGRHASARRRIDSTLAIRDTTVVPPVVRGLLVGARGWSLLMAGDTAAGLVDLRRALEEAATPRDELRSAPWRFQFALALASRPETRAEGIRWLRNGFNDPLLIPLTYFALGRAYHASGDRQAAIAAYSHFARLWDKADPPLQKYVREARVALGDLRD